MNTEQLKNKNLLKKTIKGFGYFMVLFYFAIGVFLLTTDKLHNYFTPIQKNGIGVIVIVYGLFRGYRIFKDKNSDQNN